MGDEWTLREKSLDIERKMVRINNLLGSEQQKDLTQPPNCGGYGRIRHFRINRYKNWSADPLPNLPAATALGRLPDDVLKAQVFQIAACNWNCWYCFVDRNRRNADRTNSKFLTAKQLVELMLQEKSRPDVIDLSGGQPDIVPEWTLWMMEALVENGIENEIFLWNDDNLSTDFLTRFLSRKQIAKMAGYPKYARVGCFKGFDSESFSFNTLASTDRFDLQFRVFTRLLKCRFDMYAYVTFTSPPVSNLSEKMETFVDKLQSVHENLPLRTVPLKIEVFTPTKMMMNPIRECSLQYQYKVHSEWCRVLESRYTESERAIPINEVILS